MSLYKRGSIYWYKFQKGGKPYSASTRTNDKAKAELVYAQAKDEAGSISRVIRRMDDPGIYFLLSPLANLIKIGCSGNVNTRVEDIKRVTPDELQLLAVIKTDRYQAAEELLHELFWSKHHRNEWFRITEEDVQFAVKFWDRIKDAKTILDARKTLPVERDRLYTAEEVAELFSIAPSTIRKWMSTGYLPKVRLGKLARVEGKAIREFIEGNTHTKRREPVTEIVTKTPVDSVTDRQTVAGTNG